jgi:hypothetical protein
MNITTLEAPLLWRHLLIIYFDQILPHLSDSNSNRFPQARTLARAFRPRFCKTCSANLLQTPNASTHKDLVALAPTPLSKFSGSRSGCFSGSSSSFFLLQYQLLQDYRRHPHVTTGDTVLLSPLLLVIDAGEPHIFIQLSNIYSLCI